jgi:hypothetical protein
MARQRVTIRLPRALVEGARLTAAGREISLSRMMAEALEQQVERDERYEAAWGRQRALLLTGLDLGFDGCDRASLHAR